MSYLIKRLKRAESIADKHYKNISKHCSEGIELWTFSSDENEHPIHILSMDGRSIASGGKNNFCITFDSHPVRLLAHEDVEGYVKAHITNKIGKVFDRELFMHTMDSIIRAILMERMDDGIITNDFLDCRTSKDLFLLIKHHSPLVSQDEIDRKDITEAKATRLNRLSEYIEESFDIEDAKSATEMIRDLSLCFIELDSSWQHTFEKISPSFIDELYLLHVLAKKAE